MDELTRKTLAALMRYVPEIAASLTLDERRTIMTPLASSTTSTPAPSSATPTPASSTTSTPATSSSSPPSMAELFRLGAERRALDDRIAAVRAGLGLAAEVDELEQLVEQQLAEVDELEQLVEQLVEVDELEQLVEVEQQPVAGVTLVTREKVAPPAIAEVEVDLDAGATPASSSSSSIDLDAGGSSPREDGRDGTVE